MSTWNDPSYKNYVYAFLFTSLSKTLCSPLNVVVTRLQCQGELLKSGVISNHYSGPLSCFKRISKEEGNKAFWKGNLTHLIRNIASKTLTVCFATYLHPTFDFSEKKYGYWQNIFGKITYGFVIGSCSMLFDYSLEFVTTRLINDLGKKKYNGIIDVYRQTLNSDGIAGLYRGIVVSSLGLFAYRGVYFSLYGLGSSIIPDKYDKTYKAYAILGIVTSSIACLATYPIDTIRKRMMMRSGEEVKYSGARDCFRYILQNEGVRPLFNGAGIRILCTFGGAFLLPFFDYQRKNMRHTN